MDAASSLDSHPVALAESAVGYTLQRGQLPTAGHASLYQDRIIITDDATTLEVFNAALLELNSFKRTTYTISFKHDTTPLGLSFKPLQMPNVVGADSQDLKSQAYAPVAREWQNKLQQLGIPVSNSWFNKIYDILTKNASK